MGAIPSFASNPPYLMPITLLIAVINYNSLLMFLSTPILGVMALAKDTTPPFTNC